MYARLLLILLPALFIVAPLHAQKDSATYGFKGIHLGMTRSEVDALLKRSGWGMQVSKGHRDDSIPSDKAFVVLNSDDPVPPVTAVVRENLSTLGCLDDSCAYFNWVLLRFANDRVYQIIVLTANYSMTPESVGFYTNVAIAVVAGLYGDPIKVIEPIESTIDRLAKSPPPLTFDIAQWRRSTNGRQESVVVQAKRFSTQHLCEIRIVMTDEEAFRNARVSKEDETPAGR